MKQLFVQLEGGESIFHRDVIGIFDAETAMREGSTKDALMQAQKERRLCNVANDLPQSVVLVHGSLFCYSISSNSTCLNESASKKS